MIALENPLGFVVRTEAQKAAADNGFRLERGTENGWLHYGSTTAPGSLWIANASSQGPWLLSIDHSGVVAEIGALLPSPVPGPGLATFIFARLAQLHAALDRVYKLAVSLPDAPLGRFQVKTAGLPRTTEAERLVIQRIGQHIFRDALMHYWGAEIALDCGYPASSLKERVYALSASDGTPQRCDILIYTATAGAQGTLGGLVATATRFAQILEGALERSMICSNDPICADHQPGHHGGDRATHGAACHGCLLRNLFLDRNLLVPTMANDGSSLFDIGRR